MEPQQVVFIGVASIVLVIILYITYVSLEGIGYLSTVSVLSDQVLETNQFLVEFLIKNKDKFYSPKNWEVIVQAQNKIKELEIQELKYKDDLVYIESVAKLKIDLKSDFEKKIFGLLNAKARQNKDFISYIKSIFFLTVELSNNHRRKPLGRFFQNQYRKNYNWAVRCVNSTKNLLKTIGLHRDAQMLELWGVA